MFYNNQTLCGRMGGDRSVYPKLDCTLESPVGTFKNPDAQVLPLVTQKTKRNKQTNQKKNQNSFWLSLFLRDLYPGIISWTKKGYYFVKATYNHNVNWPLLVYLKSHTKSFSQFSSYHINPTFDGSTSSSLLTISVCVKCNYMQLSVWTLSPSCI